MKELVIISGKGGTGKTTLMAAFASLAENRVLCDADVDAADLHLIMNPKILENHDFQGGNEAIIDPEKCTSCGICQGLCRWKAINDDYVIDPLSCEGCGVCVYFCPEKAIEFPVKTCGEWYISDTRFGPMVHTRLGIAEENSGKLVTQVRQKSQELAEEKGLNLILTDGPPAVGCSVIASIGGASAVLIVTEPTVSGKHDLERVAQLAAHFKIKAMVCVNKSDLNPDKTQDIRHYAREKGLIFLGEIPFDPDFTRSMIKGQTIFEYNGDSSSGQAIREIWDGVGDVLELNK